MKRINALLIAIVLLMMPFSVFAKTETAIFAGGCFWCVEEAFEGLPGVEKVVSGYTGGAVKNPSYEQVSAGGTGHYESIEVYFDSDKTTYATLLNVFWKNVDPVDAGGQFCDKGQQYRAAIFYADPEQKKLADESKEKLLKSGKFKTIATQILPASTFYSAEEYHQDYAKKNSVRYHYYRLRCGRDQRLEEVWG